jgi:predicted component of type VI protein secretion system
MSSTTQFSHSALAPLIPTHALSTEILADGRVRLLDDRSSNGTFVNGRQVAEVELHDGDVIRVGPVELRYLELSAKHEHPRQRTTGAGPRASETRSQRAFEGWVASLMRTRSRERRTHIASGPTHCRGAASSVAATRSSSSRLE